MNHINYGNGKGKTTAALGIALRMIAHGKRVLFVSFLKDGTSGEVRVLQSYEKVKVLYKAMPKTFLFQMEETEKAKTLEEQRSLYEEARTHFAQYDYIVLDEVLDAFVLQVITEDELLQDINTYRDKEIVMTGRMPSEKLMQQADYLNEFVSHRHPYEKGIAARSGVEY